MPAEDGRPRPVIVGSGFIARRHAAVLLAEGIPPIAVFSPNRSHAEDAARSWGCEAATNLQAALDAPGATHVHVCSPPVQHEVAVAEAARRGLRILCEKPLAPTGGAAERMEEAVGAAGVEAHVLFNLRLEPGVRMLRDAVRDGRIGRPVSVFATYRQQWNADPSTRDWRFDEAYVGPSRVVTEIGSHLFDLVSFVLGYPVEAVSAFSASMGERTFDTGTETGRFAPTSEDLFSAHLRLANGTVGEIFCTELAHGSYDEIELRVDGTARSARWRSARPSQWTLGHKLEGETVHGLGVRTDSVAACISSIYSGGRASADVATFADGASNARVLDAVRLSAARTGWWDT